MNARYRIGTILAAAVAAIVVMPPPAAEAGRTCESMGDRWYSSDQGATCDDNCSEACIVKWDCDGEPCEPHHCWKCAAGAPAPPAPTPPPPGPGDAGGVRCDAMGEGWYFANQGNACNDNCSEACIPKWDCGGQPCRPHHCWKCAAGAPPQDPGPSDPGDGGGGPRRIPGALTHKSWHFDDENVYFNYHLEAIDSNERVEVEIAIKSADGTLLGSGARQDQRQVDLTIAVPLGLAVPDEEGVGAGLVPPPIVEIVAKVAGRVSRMTEAMLRHPANTRVSACYTLHSSDAFNCYYRNPTQICGPSLCVPELVVGRRFDNFPECKPFARMKGRAVVLQPHNKTRCLPNREAEGVDQCSACSGDQAVPR